MAINKERLTKMIQHLSDKDLELVNELVERLTSFNYPLDDEPTTPDDLTAIQKGYKAMENNEFINFTEIEDELRNQTP